MFRFVQYGQVRAGKWREFFALYEQMDNLMRERKFVPEVLLWPVVGTLNTFMITADYETIEAFQSEGMRFESDAEIMAIWRKTADYTEGIGRTELWETSRQIA